jgi:hypothetical protein
MPRSPRWIDAPRYTRGTSLKIFVPRGSALGAARNPPMIPLGDGGSTGPKVLGWT